MEKEKEALQCIINERTFPSRDCEKSANVLLGNQMKSTDEIMRLLFITRMTKEALMSSLCQLFRYLST